VNVPSDGESPGSISETRLRGWHLVAGIAAALVVAAAVILGVGRVAGYAHLGDAIQGADYRWLVLCLVGQIGVFAGYAGSLRVAVAAVDDRARVPVGMSVRIVLASFAATQVFAFGGVAGLALIFWALRKVGMRSADAAVRLIGLSTAVYLVFGVLAWWAALLSLVSDEAPLGMTVPWLVGIPIVLLAARWFTEPRRVRRLDDSSDGVLRRALATGVGAAAWVRAMLHSDRGRRLFGWAGLYWLGDVLSLWAALRAFGAAPAIPALAIAYATGYLAQSLPIPFIATGGVDAATTFALHTIGVPLDAALAGVVAHRLFAFWLPVIPGSIFALTLPRLGTRLERLNPAAAV
jgi:uncharacterized membrane protein YbhN (UPF0104 family)